MGAERKSAVISEKSRRLTAYHEGGHALVAMHTAGADPVHKATVVPRGLALGMVTQLPEEDAISISRKQVGAGTEGASMRIWCPTCSAMLHAGDVSWLAGHRATSSWVCRQQPNAGCIRDYLLMSTFRNLTPRTGALTGAARCRVRAHSCWRVWTSAWAGGLRRS